MELNIPAESLWSDRGGGAILVDDHAPRRGDRFVAGGVGDLLGRGKLHVVGPGETAERGQALGFGVAAVEAGETFLAQFIPGCGKGKQKRVRI